jgi:hypothetical protein
MKYPRQAAFALLVVGPVFAGMGTARSATKYDRLHRYCVTTSQHAKEQYQTNLGPTGAMGWVYINRIYIEAVEKGSPADGLLKKGDYLIGVNGKRFPDIDPRVMLGEAITRAEAGDGVLRLRVANKQKERSVTVRIEPIGRYSPTWPFNCTKSAGIRDRALAWLRKHQRDDGTFGLSVYTSFNGLFLLSSPRPEDQEAARRCAYGRLDGPPSDCYNAWSYGYSAMFLAEYYLATGDALVLPRIELYAKEIAEGQTRSGSWCHGMVKFGVPGGYGELNQAGIMCFMSLVLARECGVAVDEEALGKARRFFGRFAGLGHIPYGNHPPWTKTPASNGKNAIAAVAFNILGDREKTRAFADSTTCGPEYLEAAHTGSFWGVAWNPLGMIHSDRASFHSFQKVQLWYYDLGRRWDGGFKYLPNPENLTGFTGFEGKPDAVTGGYGLVFALPWRSLRILGADKCPFSSDVHPFLRNGVALYKEKKWDAFDAWAARWRWKRVASGARKQSRALLAKRDNIKKQIAWTLAAVEEKAAKGALPRSEIVRARAMLKAVERLAGTELDAARRLRARLDAVRETPDGRPGKRGRNLKWRPLLPLANQMKKSDRPKTWRVYGWTKEISPALDNLEPAAPNAKGWYLPGFDDTKWQEKKAPFRVHKSHRMELKPHPVGHHAEMYQPRPLYNSYARTRFDVADPRSIKAMRVVIQNGHQYLRSELYLNGYRAAAILRPNSCELAPEAVKLLKPTRNCLAVYLSSHRGHLHDFDFGLEVSR